MASSDRSRPARRRRSFTAQEKADFVRRYDETPHGRKGMFLRENNLYESNIGKWRRAVSGPVTKPSGPDPRLVALEAENAALRESLAVSQRTVDTLGKAFVLLEGISKSSDTTGS